MDRSLSYLAFECATICNQQLRILLFKYIVYQNATDSYLTNNKRIFNKILGCFYYDLQFAKSQSNAENTIS